MTDTVFTIDEATRTARGLLVPWGEQTDERHAYPTIFNRGTITVPRDISILRANRDHSLTDPVAVFTSTEDTDAGLVATFKIAEDEDGDALIEAHKRGELTRLSGEFRRLVRKGSEVVSAVLTGAAFTSTPAFASAGLFTLDAVTEQEPEVEPAAAETLEPDEAGDVAIATTETPETVTVTASDIETTFRPERPELTKEETMTAAIAAGAETEAPAVTAPSANEVFELIARTMKGDREAEAELFTLADIKTSGTGSLPVGGTAIQPAWLSEVHAQNPYITRYKSLIRRGPIVAFDEKGFTVATASEAVQPWAGNKADVPTITGTTSSLSSVFQRWGVGNDIAREFFDIPAGRPVVEAFLRLIDVSYDRVTDYWTLQQLIASAGSAVPYDATGVPTGYNAALAKVIQVIDLVDNTDAEPTAVVVAADVWKALRYTQKDMIPEYVTFGLRRTEGTADGVTVLKDKAGKLAAGQVLGVSSEAAHVNELNGGSPIHLEALDIARGGIDKAVIGYTQYMADYPAGLVLLGNGS